LFFVAAGMFAIWRHCRRHRYDVIHVHWPMPLALLGWAAQQGGGQRVPLVSTFYGVELRWVKGSLRALKWLVRWAARRSDRVVAISTYTAAELRELADVPIEVIPYTTSLPEPPALPRTGGGVATVLFVGRLVERKGVPVLIEAMSLLPGGGSVRLEIVGEGPERPTLEAAAQRLGIADRIEFRGKVSSAELQAAYARASAFVLPSIFDARGDTEGLGVVALEAMNYGTPVVASRIGGIPDIVEDGVTGVLVPPGDAAALAAALRRVLDEPGLARKLGEAGRRRLHEQFSWEAITARWEAVYASLR
jgi:glycosyltransferase involved in cell wall biosynthesis